MKTIFFNLLKQQVVEYLTKKFTAENVQELLDKVLTLAKAKAKETQTELDDTLVKAVEYLIKDTNAAEKLVSLALTLLDGARLYATPFDEPPIGDQIAAELADWAKDQW